MFAIVPDITSDPLAVVVILFAAAVVLGFVLYTSYAEQPVGIVKGKRRGKGFRRKNSGFLTASKWTGRDLNARAKFSSSAFLQKAPMKPKSEFNVWMKSDPAGKAVGDKPADDKNVSGAA